MILVTISPNKRETEVEMFCSKADKFGDYDYDYCDNI